jgi:hypothetical protein
LGFAMPGYPIVLVVVLVLVIDFLSWIQLNARGRSLTAFGGPGGVRPAARKDR